MAKYSDYVGFRSSDDDSRSIQTSGVDRLTITASGEWNINGSGYGASGQVLTSQGTGNVPRWASIPAPPGANIQEFSTSSTWTKPSGCNFVLVEGWGAGGGGGGGGLTASSLPNTNTVFAGAGGGGGAYEYRFFNASSLTSTVQVTIGAGGAGGSGSTITTTTGNSTDGLAGGDTSFGGYFTIFGGNGGTKGVPSGYSITPLGGAGGSTITRTVTGRTAGQPSNNNANESFGGGAGAGSGAFDTNGSDSGFGGGGGGRFGGTGGASLYGGAGGNGPATLISGIGNSKINNTPVGFWGSGGQAGLNAMLEPSRQSAQNIYFINNTFITFNSTLNSTNGIGVSTNSGVNWNYYPAYLNIPSGDTNGVSSIYSATHDGSRWAIFGRYDTIRSDFPIYTATGLTNPSGWTKVTATGFDVPFFSLAHVVYATGLYVAVGGDTAFLDTSGVGYIYTSTNLTGWTRRATGIALNALGDIYYDGNRWITVGASGFNAYSTDGITWTTGTQVLSGGSSTLYGVAGSGGIYVVRVYNFGNVGLFRTTNTGSTWTALTGVGAGLVSSKPIYVAPSGTFMVAAATGSTTGLIQRSTDGGATWPNVLTYVQGIVGGASYSQLSVAFGNNTYVVAPTAPGRYMQYSTNNGASWTSGTISNMTGFYPIPTPGGTGSLACGGGGGAPAMSGFGVGSGGAGGSGGNGYLRVYSW